MVVLSGKNEEIALEYIASAEITAKMATCSRSNCGSIIVAQNEIIGTGFNSPPKHLEGQRRCSCDKGIYDSKVTDKTCCVHAEQRAMIDALKWHPGKIAGSSLYFIRLKNGVAVRSREPYCTICSKMALDIGIKDFILWREAGVCVYDTEEYNKLSYEYQKPQITINKG